MYAIIIKSRFPLRSSLTEESGSEPNQTSHKDDDSQRRLTEETQNSRKSDCDKKQ